MEAEINFLLTQTHLVDVGNSETIDPTRVVDEILAIEMYPADSSRIVVVSWAQYNEIPQEPEIIRPKTVERNIETFKEILIWTSDVKIIFIILVWFDLHLLECLRFDLLRIFLLPTALIMELAIK